MVDFDVVILGTSPLSLIEALYQKTVLGKSVLVLDKNKFYGGAWYTKDLFGYNNVEVGCHYFSRSRLGYRFLEKNLGVELEDVDRHFLDFRNPQEPLNTDNGLIVNDDPFRLLKILRRYGIQVGVSLLKGDFKEILFVIRRLSYKGAFKYPKYGCSDIVSRLVNENHRVGNILRMNTKVEKIENGNSVTLFLENSPSIKCKTFYCGQANNIPIFEEKREIKTPVEKVRSIHYILRIKGKKENNFTIIQKGNNSIYHWKDNENYFFRVTDVGRYFSATDNRPPESELLLCCQISDKQYSGNETPEMILSYLKNLKLVSEDSIVLDSYLDFFHGCMIIEEEFHKLPNMPNIHFIESWDLVFAMEKYYDRWKKIKLQRDYE